MSSNAGENKIIEFILDHYFIAEYRNAVYLDDDLKDLIQMESKRGHRLLITGSVGEAIQNGSDRDVMTMLPLFMVVELADQIPADYLHYVFQLDQTDCRPCFARLKLLRKSIEGGEVVAENRYFTEHNGELYLNKSKFVSRASQHYKKYMYDDNDEQAPLHGPALLVEETGETDMDFVPCLKMPIWPSFCQDTLLRIQNSASLETRNQIEAEGCHLVGVPHPNSIYGDIEFRISFSIAEKLMIRTWTTKQMKLYFLCKELFNARFKAENHPQLDKGLCSYFAKTIILWMVEDRTKEYWEETFLLDILDDFFGMLSSYLSDQSCPNYFIPSGHLMETYTESQIEKLQERIKTVRKRLFLCLLPCKSFKYVLEGRSDEVYTKCRDSWEGDDGPGITDALAEVICNGDYFHNKDGTTTKDTIYYERMRGLIGQFMIFCQSDYWTYVSWYQDDPVRVLTKINTILYSKFEAAFGGLYCHYFHCAIMRSIAHNLMDDAYRLLFQKKITTGEFLGYFNKVESCILGAYRFNGVLSDHNISGLVYLGLVHDRFGYKTKAKQFFVRALQQCDNANEFVGRSKILRMPIIITGRYGKVPAFFYPDTDIRALFEECHMHQIEFDPIVLALYLLVMLGCNEWLEQFKTLDQTLPFLQLPVCGEQSTTLRESYHFLKSRLGLMNDEELLNYRLHPRFKNKQICPECSEIELFNQNLDKPNTAATL